MEMEKKLPVMLLLSASDPDGTLGIQTDISVLSSMKRRVFVSTVVTSHVVRRGNGLVSLKPVPADVLRSQLRTAVETFHPDVVKVGLMADAVSVCEITAILRRERFRKIIYSPGLEDEAGHALLSADTEEAIACHLMPVVQLLITERRPAERLLRMKRKVLPVKTMTDVQLSRCLISTFHCSCYLSVPAKSDILAMEKELFYYRPVEKQLPETPLPQIHPAYSEKPSQPLLSGESPVSSSVSSSSDRFRRFSSAVAGCWAGTEDVKKPLYEAKRLVREVTGRERYLNENHAAAPYYPLTDGGNYE